MKIAFYAPFKPLGHKNPSGDLVIARGLVGFLKEQGHHIEVQSTLRARWIYLKPWLWPLLFVEFLKCLKRLKNHPLDVWLTYHTYYKAPDLLGPWVCRLLGIKYVIFQGIYSTKRRRKLKTILGFYLNRVALSSACHVFTNKLSDLKNLKRIVPFNRLTYVKPGIYPRQFGRNEKIGQLKKKLWGIDETFPVILTACMFRDDVKTQGLSWLIQCCEKLVAKQVAFHLVIAGEGKMEKELKNLAQKYIPGHFTFAGKFNRQDMYQFYSAGDLFAFPGIRESLGMVYLEAQACGLPVVAFDNGGIPEVVANKKTGFLLPMYDSNLYADRLINLLGDDLCRCRMGKEATLYVRDQHDIDKNYRKFEQCLIETVS